MEAGATEVVIEAVESVVRFAALLGTRVEAVDSLLRLPLATMSSGDGGSSRRTAAGDAPGSKLPYPEEELESLAAECGITSSQIGRLYAGFAMLEPNDDGEVDFAALRGVLMRTKPEGAAARVVFMLD